MCHFTGRCCHQGASADVGRGGLVRDDCEGDDRRQGREGRAEPYHKEERRYEGAAAATGSELKKVFATLFYLFLKIFWFLAFLWPKLHLLNFFFKVSNGKTMNPA